MCCFIIFFLSTFDGILLARCWVNIYYVGLFDILTLSLSRSASLPSPSIYFFHSISFLWSFLFISILLYNMFGHSISRTIVHGLCILKSVSCYLTRHLHCEYCYFFSFYFKNIFCFFCLLQNTVKALAAGNAKGKNPVTLGVEEHGPISNNTHHHDKNVSTVLKFLILL